MIDNIFVNITNGKIKSDLLVTDVSDHLPVYAVLEMDDKLLSKMEGQTNFSREKKSNHGFESGT